MSVQTALHTTALVHIRLLRNFIAATDYECAQATEDHVRDSLEETLETLHAELAAYEQALASSVVHEAA
jgi:hypothetical protein